MILSLIPHIEYCHPTLYEGIERVVSPGSSSWLFWWLVADFVCLCVAMIFTPGLIKSRIQALLGIQKRQSIFSPTSFTDLRTIVSSALFTLISFSLGLFLWCYHPQTCSHSVFLKAMACVASWLVIKTVLMALVFYVFFDFKRFSEQSPTVAQCHFFAALGVFAAVCMRLFLPENLTIVSSIMLIITALAFAIIGVVKILQHFFGEIIDFLHIFLYLCMVEILPFMLMVSVYLTMC